MAPQYSNNKLQFFLENDEFIKKIWLDLLIIIVYINQLYISLNLLLMYYLLLMYNLFYSLLFNI